MKDDNPIARGAAQAFEDFLRYDDRSLNQYVDVQKALEKGIAEDVENYLRSINWRSVAKEWK